MTDDQDYFRRHFKYAPPDWRGGSPDSESPNHCRNFATYQVVVYLDIADWDGVRAAAFATHAVRTLGAVKIPRRAQVSILQSMRHEEATSQTWNAFQGDLKRDADGNLSGTTVGWVKVSQTLTFEAVHELLPTTGHIFIDSRFHGNSVTNPNAWAIELMEPVRLSSEEVKWYDGKVAVVINGGYMYGVAPDRSSSLFKTLIELASGHFDVMSGYVHIVHNEVWGHPPWTTGEHTTERDGRDLCFLMHPFPRRNVVRDALWGSVLSPELARKFDGEEGWIAEFATRKSPVTEHAPQVIKLPSGHVFLTCTQDINHVNPARYVGEGRDLAIRNMAWLRRRYMERGMLA